MRSFLYISSRKASTDKGTDGERTNAKKQVWMKKTEQLQIGAVDQCKEYGFHMASEA